MKNSHAVLLRLAGSITAIWLLANAAKSVLHEKEAPAPSPPQTTYKAPAEGKETAQANKAETTPT